MGIEVVYLRRRSGQEDALAGGTRRKKK